MYEPISKKSDEDSEEKGVKNSLSFDGDLPSLPNFSSHFALCRLAPTHFALYILPLCHLAQSSFCPLTIYPFCQFTLFRFAQCHLALLSFRPFTTSPNAILPFYHLAPLSFHHTVSVSLKLLVEYSTRFPGIGAQTVTWYRVRIQRIIVYSFLEELEL